MMLERDRETERVALCVHTTEESQQNNNKLRKDAKEKMQKRMGGEKNKTRQFKITWKEKNS